MQYPTIDRFSTKHFYLLLAGVCGLITAALVVFFYLGGYNYQLVDRTPAAEAKARYQPSQQCLDQQAQKETLQAPLKAEMQPLAAHMAYDELPLEGADKMYDRYVVLRDQVNALEIMYAC